jgi:Cu/Ag efflux protein CusF
MFRRLSLLVIALLLGTLAADFAQAQEVQRGTLKKLDVEKHLIVVTIDGKDHELTLTDDTQVLGGQGDSLAEKLRSFKEGSEIFVKAGQRGGKQVVQGIRLAEPGRGAQPQAGIGGERPQRGKVKTIDVDGRTITLIVGGKDLALVLTDQTRIRGVRGETLAEQWKSLEPGANVMFVAADRDGRKVLIGLILLGMTDSSGSGDNKLVSPEHAKLRPLDELGTNQYQSYVGGLYSHGHNMRPREHETEGLKLAAQVRPLDAEGNPHPAGKIVVLSIGMSNTAQSSEGFQSVLTGYDRKNPRVMFVNGAGGMTLEAIRNPDDSERGAQYWTDVEQRLKQNGATRAQVQAIWVKIAWGGPRDGFPEHARRLQAELMRLVQVLPQRFPNAKLAYVSSRSYGGYATTPLNPEPYAYESGFSVRWLIEEQLKGHPDLNYDASKGTVKSLWLSWGPYLWANGQSRRAADGLSWEQADFADDGTHLSAAGRRKVGQLLLDFFKSDPTTKGWFNRQ